ncbi:casein kinase I isoform delta-A, partial [Reticulomyxa filosa]
MDFEIRVARNQYLLGRKVGSGSFGVIYEAKHALTGEVVAVKLENTKTQCPQLHYEYKIYKNMKGTVGVPLVKWFGTEEEFNILVMQMLGPSLEELFNYCGRQFSLKTVCLLAEQMVRTQHSSILKIIMIIIIVDIPFFFPLCNNKKKKKKVHVIDFGLAKHYIVPETQEHIPFVRGKSLTGTARYASANTHLGYEQSRRDDLETLGYVLLYFIKQGKLPWQGLKAKTKQAKYSRIASVKQKTSIEVLCEGLPQEFAQYLSYCRKLEFDEKPDYHYLRNLFRKLFQKQQFVDDGQYDWTLKAIKE